MKKFLILLVVLFSVTAIYSVDKKTEEDSNAVYNPFKPNPQQSKWYYGGNIGFNFWNDYFYLTVQPLVGYKVTPKFSVGGKLGYTYYSTSNPDFSSHNYGGSLFTRYRVIPQFYLHGEFVYFSYERQTLVNQQLVTERLWVPFLLLGGGFSQMVSPNVWAFVEVLFDVLNDTNSPYHDQKWDPFVSFGVGVGF